MSSKNSQCETIVPMLDAFVDNELDESEKGQVLMHVQSCDDCKSHVKEIEALKTSLASLPRRKMNIDLADNFDQLLKKEPETESAKPSSVVPITSKRKWIVAATSAAAVAVIAIAGSLVSRGGGEQVANSNSDSNLGSATQTIAQHAGASDNPSNISMKTADGNSIAERRKAEGAAQKPETGDAQLVDTSAHDSQSKVAANLHSGSGKENGSGLDNVKTGGAHLNENVAQSQSSNTTVVALDANSSSVKSQKDRSATSELLALYEEDDGIGSDIGMITDEDGLYAIEL